MTESGNLQHSLMAMGLVELALAFAAIGGYALALNAALGARARVRAAVAALAAAAGFVAMTEPWVNGFILAVLAVAGIGIFTAMVWAVSVVCGLTEAVPPSDGEPLEAPLHGVGATPAFPLAGPAEAAPATEAPSPRARPGSPAHSG